jgi:ribosome assembly protein YihI (activator of Der GTPase)
MKNPKKMSKRNELYQSIKKQAISFIDNELVACKDLSEEDREWLFKRLDSLGPELEKRMESLGIPDLDKFQSNGKIE